MVPVAVAAASLLLGGVVNSVPPGGAPPAADAIAAAITMTTLTASPMSPVRIVTFGFGGSSGLWVRRNMGPEKG